MSPGDSGMLIVGGDELETFALYVESGRLVGTYQNIFQDSAFSLQSDELPMGVVSARFELGPADTAAPSRHRRGSLFVNGRCMGHTPLIEYSIALDAMNSRVAARQSLENLAPTHTFTGKIRNVVPRWSIVP